MLVRLARAVGRAVARVVYRLSRRRRPGVLLIEADEDVGFILETTLRDGGFAVMRRDRLDLGDCRRPGVVLASIGLGPEAATETAWLDDLRARCPDLPLVALVSVLGGPLRAALAADRHARILYHPVTAEQYLAAVADLLGAPLPRAA